MIAGGAKWAGNSGKQIQAIVLDEGGLAVHQTRRTYNTSTKDLAHALMAQTDAMRFDFSDLRKAEYLEPAAVGQDGTVPTHETMEAAGGADDFDSGPDIQMIGVAQNDLRAQLAEILHQIVGERVVVINHDNHESLRVVNGTLRAAIKSLPRQPVRLQLMLRLYSMFPGTPQPDPSRLRCRLRPGY